MSKDKYRPSIADFEVVQTEVRRRGVDPGGAGLGGTTTGGGGSGDGALTGPREQTSSNWYPKNLRVASQTVKYNEQGYMRVDVTLEWDELDSANSYYVRVAEVGLAR